MNKLQSLLALTTALGGMLPEDQIFMHEHGYSKEAEHIVLDKPDKYVPKGAKQYFFNDDGEFSTDHMRKTECVFDCVASNDRNAMRKFYNWNIKMLSFLIT